MSTNNQTGFIPAIARGAIQADDRVIQSAAEFQTGDQLVVEPAGSDEKGFGTAVGDTAAGRGLTIKLFSQGSHIGTISGAISAGDPVFASPNGKIAASGSVVVGTSGETGDHGDDIQYFPAR